MKTKLYVILGSHACRTGMLLLEHKGIDYEPVVLPTGFHPVLLRLHGFPGNPAQFRRLDEQTGRMVGPVDRLGTVPSLEYDGERIKTNREIARFLERVKPEPPLFPADPKRRAAVEEAERWGDEVLQMGARRLVSAAGARDELIDRASSGRLGPLLWRRPGMRAAGLKVVARTFHARAGNEQKLRASVLEMLDRVDGWIAGDVLNGERLYAADLTVAPSLALLSYREDMRAEIERRPALALLDRVLPEPAAAAAA